MLMLKMLPGLMMRFSLMDSQCLWGRMAKLSWGKRVRSFEINN